MATEDKTKQRSTHARSEPDAQTSHFYIFFFQAINLLGRTAHIQGSSSPSIFSENALIDTPRKVL
jgi:hypothetical protein